jgi:lysophospholipase L1-like esterase
VKALRAAGGKPHYSEYVGLGHDSWSAAYSEPEFLPWLFSQKLGRGDAYPLRIDSPELPPVARFPADEAFPGKGPIRKMDWFRNLWRERRLAWWKSREQDRGAVVFLGDSITQGWDSLAKDFPGLKTANRGISGDVTRGVLCRLRGDVLDLDPRLVVILLGTNDIEEGAAPETIAANLRAILDAIRAHEPPCPVVVCEVFPSHASKSRPVETIRRSNALIREAVRGRPRTTLLETYALFADSAGNAKAEEFPDLLHPNAAGYAKWAEALRAAFVTLGMDPRGGSGGETK